MERPDSVEMSAWGVASLAGLQVGGFVSLRRGLSGRPPGLWLC